MFYESGHTQFRKARIRNSKYLLICLFNVSLRTDEWFSDCSLWALPEIATLITAVVRDFFPLGHQVHSDSLNLMSSSLSLPYRLEAVISIRSHRPAVACFHHAAPCISTCELIKGKLKHKARSSGAQLESVSYYDC